ncbi:homoserine O-succinyltransferase [Abyssogena phaseoliformis symbiont OG214]|uniref:homoserine O-succinyltransferase MetA n=1 Tax=Abyssogena phaseoliformis symbiont TaxID=596095 RepID=UPI001915673C|nr:homoserine O-succinyltransferase [Abyssogena phaseoliformis symbiont]MBW5288743.1 Homoserine O-succinyltransferase [Candidatus Ruthia sp. Apha_13_S6]BBB22227.1 homoserine O-succinyltransferase [Abyssogena phaseoliformis symbiont OG214]
MPLIAHSNLPSFVRLKDEGETILSKDRANNQAIRELHIGLLNMMPDAALEATERQFFRLVGHSNQIAQFYLHPFTLSSIKRNKKTSKHVKQHYQTFADIKAQGLDALIITGAHIEQAGLQKAPFYEELKEVVDWSYDHVTSTLCSCLATHAVLEFRYGQKRQAIGEKCWGVFPHQVLERQHPLMNGVNTRFDVPHSRFNEISKAQFNAAGVKILVESKIGIHLGVSEDLLRVVFFQGHPEYDTISLLKEYKRDIIAYLEKTRDDYPPFPKYYLTEQSKAILNEYKTKLLSKELSVTDFPEQLISKTLDNTWGNATNVIINNWIGCVYQTTHEDINKPFMDGINPHDPLNLK